MGTGTTIKTGGNKIPSTRGLGTVPTNYYNRNQNPYLYGKVIEVTKDEQGKITIVYTPLEDRISSNGNEKQGIAHPFYPNNAAVPSIGSIVPLLKGPSLSTVSDVNNVTSQYDKSTYYLDPVSIEGTVNNNTVSTTSEVSTNTSAASYNNNNIGASSSPILPGKISTSKAAIQNNRIFTKDFLKKKGLTKEQAAGIMGNAEAECGFKVEMPPNQDTKGFSFGLIQWNSNSYPDAYQKLMPTQADPRSAIEKQCEALFNGYTSGMNKYMKQAVNPIPNEWVQKYGLSTNVLNADIAAFIFARTVEICSYCTKTKAVYDNGGTIAYRGKNITVHPRKRSEYALAFMEKFNNPKDQLYWG